MAHIQIQIDRGAGWQDRQSGETALPPAFKSWKEWSRGGLPPYCVTYPHRLLVDGAEVATCLPGKTSEHPPRLYFAAERPTD